MDTLAKGPVPRKVTDCHPGWMAQMCDNRAAISGSAVDKRLVARLGELIRAEGRLKAADLLDVSERALQRRVNARKRHPSVLAWCHGLLQLTLGSLTTTPPWQPKAPAPLQAIPVPMRAMPSTAGGVGWLVGTVWAARVSPASLQRLHPHAGAADLGQLARGKRQSNPQRHVVADLGSNLATKSSISGSEAN